jgi:hypothetical protein
MFYQFELIPKLTNCIHLHSPAFTCIHLYFPRAFAMPWRDATVSECGGRGLSGGACAEKDGDNALFSKMRSFGKKFGYRKFGILVNPH